MHPLDDIFGPEGPLRRVLPQFAFRREQLHMAERVAQALEGRETLIIEAGTGVGKTFAYLVPALLCGLRVLVSTGTRALQDQLFNKDLPLIAGALGRPVRIALLKGRANYLCRHRLERAAAAQARLDTHERWLARLERWARTTRTGDLAEVPDLPDGHPLWHEVTSTRENCLGTGCAEFSRCHVAAARRDAQEADLVIVNHHLLLADLLLKEDGFGDILGSADALILDEAHQLPDLAIRFFGASVGARRVGVLLDAVREGSQPPPERLEEVLAAHAALASRLPQQIGRHAWETCDAHLGEDCAELSRAMRALGDALAEAGEPGGAALGARAQELGSQIDRIAALDAFDGVRSVEISARGFTLNFLPFDVSERFKALLEARRSAWIFTSATLSIGEDFSHFASRLGLEDLAHPPVKIASPFDYERQSLLYVPLGLPQPAAPGYVRALLEAAWPLIEAAQGGAFLLFTSHRALGEASGYLRDRWAARLAYRLYVQGEAPRERLLQAFRADGNGVLLGTASFWEGVDVKGTALRLVIIDKLPFGSPEEPLLKTRVAHILAAGGNPFRDFQLPQAALALKQGVGRLIRSESDRGVVVIGDRRLIERPYGKVLLGTLPPMPCTRDARRVLEFLRAPAHARSGPPSEEPVCSAAAPASP